MRARRPRSANAGTEAGATAERTPAKRRESPRESPRAFQGISKESPKISESLPTPHCNNLQVFRDGGAEPRLPVPPLAGG